MGTLKDIIEFSEDLESAYIDREDLESYAEDTEQEYDEAFLDLEQELLDYSYIEEEADGRIIFHK